MAQMADGRSSGRRFEDSDDDWQCPLKTRSKTSPVKKWHEETMELSDKKRTRYPQRSIRHLEVKAAEPLQKRIDEIFRGSIKVEEALEFLNTFGAYCPVILLTDMICRIGDQVNKTSVTNFSSLIPLMTVLESISECLVKAENNLQPRALSTCIRLLGKYAQFFERYGARERLGREDRERVELLFDKVLLLWDRCLHWRDTKLNASDIGSAIVGMTTSRRLISERLAPPSATTRPITDILRDTCDILQRGDIAIRPEDLPQLIACMRSMISDSVVSKSLIRYLHSQLWKRDGPSCSLFDRMRLADTEILNFRALELFSASMVGVFDYDRLGEIEEILQDLVSAQREQEIWAETIGCFLVSCILHNYRPSQDMLDTLEHSLPSAIAQLPQKTPLMMRVGFYASTSLLILQKPPAETTLSVALSVSSGQQFLSGSALEYGVKPAIEALCLEREWAYEYNCEFEPCQLDFLITIPTDKGDLKVDLELDGFPYHSVFLIDQGRFCEVERPPKNRFRDLFLSKYGDLHVARVKADEVLNVTGGILPLRDLMPIFEEAILRAISPVSLLINESSSNSPI